MIILSSSLITKEGEKELSSTYFIYGEREEFVKIVVNGVLDSKSQTISHLMITGGSRLGLFGR